jgi:hypothetical protein
MDYSLFEVIDNVIAELEQRVQDIEWHYQDDARTEHLKRRLEHLYDCQKRGEVLLPRF